jgi:hypothetical protein
MLRVALSSKLAFETGIYGVRSDKELATYESRLAPVAFSASRLREVFLQVREWERQTDERFRDHSMLEVFYEDMLTDLNRSFNRVTSFLGVDQRSPRVDFRKQASRGLRDTIANYDALKAEFRGSEWAGFFDE